ncbi:hypothetical protein SMC37_004052 [Cronobacter sakazakii]|uniref:HofO family protein n=1 Tax=Cronobacter sakazakii TaxID=28141 RepID=UPI00025F6858|nr:hypothetical protein [Cronobacter sakazakii]AFJ97849.1 hypothetical protein ES15_0276 [Cronobacter sakazakii ES15]ELY2734722.1 hypothetical protein [Cronobacter sakazakii]ELY5837318.1 hypothetical protein [Cronobacter sakazakii]ELY6209844.1 hypothetical protein [Cronobacter sakazakii]ELY6293072.1 hypothetical protein [Cronobacter sakazakii]
MRLLIDRWLSGPLALRAACACGWLALLAAAAYAWLAPLLRDVNQMKMQFRQQAVELQALQRRQAAQPDRRDAITALEAQLVLKPFSPLTLNPGPEGHLIRWQPQGETGELELALTWPHAPAVFEALAQTDMLAHGFTLRRESDQSLRMTLQLERAHEK